MRIKQEFIDLKFAPATIRAAMKELQEHCNGEEVAPVILSLEAGDRSVHFDCSKSGIEEFLRQYKEPIKRSQFEVNVGSAATGSRCTLNCSYAHYGSRSNTEVAVGAPSLRTIEELLDIFVLASSEAHDETISKKEESKPKPRIFIGHGRPPQWRDLKDHLADHHGYEVVAYETGSRSGHTIRDILEEMANSSTLAFLVMTAEDEMEDGRFQARPNVIHEVGLFQGKLSFSRAIAILEETCDDFSNLQGIQQIRYSKGNIREVFGDVLAVIKREFGDS